MKKATLAFTTLTLLSSLTFAKVLANLQAVCVETTKQEVVRSVYMTEDKTVLIADPLTQLLVVDAVQEVAQDTVLLKSTTATGEESLQIKSSGEGSLTIMENGTSATMIMKCYPKKTSLMNFMSLIRH